MYPNIITLNAKKIIPIKSLLLVISIFIILCICNINSYYYLNKFEVFLSDFVEFDVLIGLVFQFTVLFFYCQL